MRTKTLLLLLLAAGLCAATSLAACGQTGLPPEVTMPPPVAADQSLTRSQAEAVAESTDNPQIAQANASVSAAHATYQSQRSFINPTINYASLNNLVAPTNGLDQAGNYSAYATIETNGAEHLRANQARFELRGAEAIETTTRLTVRQSVDDAYSTLQVANSQLANEEDVYGLVLKIQDLTHKQFQLGSGTQTNAIRADIALTQEEQNLITAVSAVKLARAALNVQLGRSPDMPVDAAEALTYKPVVLPPKQALLDKALSNRPEVASAQAAVDAAKANVGLQRAAYFPDLTLGRQLDAPPIEMGFVVPIDIGAIHGAVTSARDQAKALQAAAAQARLSVSADVENGYLAVVSAATTVDLYNSGVLPQTEDLLNRVEQGFSLGANTILDVIDAQQAYRSTRNSYYTAIGSYNQAVDQLTRAVGGSIMSPPAPAGTIQNGTQPTAAK